MPLNHLGSFGSLGNLRDLLPDSLLGGGRNGNGGGGRSGGRRPNKADQPSLDTDEVATDGATDGATDVAKIGGGGIAGAGGISGKLLSKSWLKPTVGSEARLTIVQITDVYTLDNFASLKTMLETIRGSRRSSGDKVVSMLTGDFLSPYLLSSIDRGKGMMNALASTPIDVLIWGNHESDIDHRTVCKHVKNFPGTWINTNMQRHDAMQHQVPYHIVDVSSPDGSNTRRIGLIAVLSNDPKLYAHFKKPGAFGGAQIDDPWETLRKYKRILEEEQHCDVVLPLQHLYCPDDYVTCKEFDFPVILSGHDHHRVDEIVDGTRLIKPGMDGVYATVLEMIWSDIGQAGNRPRIRSTFVRTDTFQPCPKLKAQTDAAYDVLLPLRNTELISVPSRFEPLSSKNARGSVTTMGQFLCSLIKESLNQTQQAEADGENKKLDAVILMGGNIRGGEEYPLGSFFSLEMLESEIKSDEVISTVLIPGHILAAGIEVTHAGDPRPGWFQYDTGIQEEVATDGSVRVATVDDKPIEHDRIYRVATKISDLGNGQSLPFKEYFTAHPELLPSKGSYFNIQAELLGYFARNLFRRLWRSVGKTIRPEIETVISNPSLLAAAVDTLDDPGDSIGESLKKVESDLRLSVLDKSGDGVVTVEEIHTALRDILGLSVHDDNTTLAEYVHAHADATGNGVVTTEDFEHFCTIGGYYSRYIDGDEAITGDAIVPASASADTNDEDDEGGIFAID